MTVGSENCTSSSKIDWVLMACAIVMHNFSWKLCNFFLIAMSVLKRDSLSVVGGLPGVVELDW